MFVFIDISGQVKEIITERNFRSGDSVRNKIYVYWDYDESVGEHNPSAVWVKYVKADQTTTTEVAGSTTLVGKELPDVPERNLSYFSYDHVYTESGSTHTGYKFYEFTVPDVVLGSATSDSNTCVLLARFVISGTNNQIGAITFPVETVAGVSSIIPDSSIDETEYNYLIRLITSGVCVKYLHDISTAELSEFIDGQIFFDTNDNKFYKKDTTQTSGYKLVAEFLEKYDKNAVRGYKDTVSDLTDLKSDQIVIVRDSTVDVGSLKYKDASNNLSPIIVDKAKADQNGDVIDTTYLKLSGGQMTGIIDMNSNRIIGVPYPTGNRQPANKIYTDTADTTLQNNITAEKTRAEGVESTLDGKITTNTNAIEALNARVDDVESSQNLADIVDTYADLLTLNVTKLKDNDKVQVLQDENAPAPYVGGSTVYRLTKTSASTGVWDYIGPYSSNTYTKTQADAKFLNKTTNDSMNGSLNMTDHQITNLADPINGTDATNKQTTETFTNNKVFRVVDGTKTYDLRIEIVGDDAVFKATER